MTAPVQVVDTNVLLYSIDRRSPQHEEARQWLDAALAGSETLAFPWIVVVAFLRLSTHPRVSASPLTPEEALDLADAWLDRPNAVTLTPSPTHLRTMRTLLLRAGTGGNIVNDAHIAALALEHKATVVSYDNDFAGFPGVRWERPDPN